MVDSLSEAARKAFDSLDLKNYEYKTEFARKYVAQGRQEGLAAGKAEAVLQFLAARGVDVPDAIRQRVLACTDPSLLDRWIQRAAVAVNADEVVAGDP